MAEQSNHSSVDTRRSGFPLSMSWKLMIPFIMVIFFTLLILLPLTNQLVREILEDETDSRLTRTAQVFADLLEETESEAQLVASFVANREDVEAIDGDRTMASTILPALKAELGVQELSYYAGDYEAGGFALFYGGPVIARRNVVNQETIDIRDALIVEAIDTGLSTSGIAIAPGSSEIIGVSPIVVDDEVNGVIIAVFVVDDEYVTSIGAILDIDAAIVKDNAPIASTIDDSSGYELMLQNGFIDPTVEFTADTVQYDDGINRRLLSYELILDGQQQGHVLVTRTLQDVEAVQGQMQNLILAFVAGLVVVVLVYTLAVIYNFALPLGRLVKATGKVREGDFTSRVATERVYLRDEVDDLTVNFNAMTEVLESLYSGLEQKVSERTEELSIALKELAVRRDEALEASKTKSLFLANMSHELRTPLNAILGYSDMLEEDAEDFGYNDIIPDLQKIQKAGRHLLALINDILDISKIEAGKIEVFTEDFNFESLLEEISTTAHPVIKDNNNTLVIDSTEKVGVIHSDVTKMRQITFNLLSNAAKFTKDGTITISVRVDKFADKDWLNIGVTDTGIGMNANQLEKVFDEFTQADSSTTRKYGGTGLGLPISNHFAQMMGGEITVTSEEGIGSTFTLRMPTHVVPPIPTDTQEVESIEEFARMVDERRKTGTIPIIDVVTVLVIDDDKTVHELLKRILTREGFKVISAYSGDEGLAIAREQKPQIITLDVMMPTTDGWAVLSKFKDDEELRDIPIVILSIVDNQSLGFALGATNYLTKPVQREKLVSVLRRYHLEKEDDRPSRLLVIEDDTDTREIFERTAQKEGWDVETAENGLAGLNRLAQNRPDLILLDLMMPEMDGLQFVLEMRRNEAWQNIPIIVITAKTLTAEDRQRLHGQVERVVQKSDYTPEKLVVEMRQVLD